MPIEGIAFMFGLLIFIAIMVHGWASAKSAEFIGNIIQDKMDELIDNLSFRMDELLEDLERIDRDAESENTDCHDDTEPVE
jgi:hypothetical protein